MTSRKQTNRNTIQLYQIKNAVSSSIPKYEIIYIFYLVTNKCIMTITVVFAQHNDHVCRYKKFKLIKQKSLTPDHKEEILIAFNYKVSK